ncbi:hypothetical protein S40293_10328 [Stachybotrys chartarum IBT 40293]|nr:hypothetical protein S40293_10328 [Stachybotrys chartarum IBT 40293]
MPKTAQGERRGATGRQHAELEAEQQEEEAAGRTNHWNKVYNLMRCTGPPCSGKYCLRGSDGKHFPIEPNSMEKLVRYSEEGNALETHADVPQSVRDLIYEKDRLDSERRSKKRKASVSAMPAIHIHNSLPEQPMCCSKELSTGPPVESDDTIAGRRRTAPNILGPRDEAIKRYCEWHCAQVMNDEWKRGFARAASITLEEGLDLKHVYIDQNINLYTKGGIKPGIARSWVEDIKKWAEESYAQG